MKQIFTSYFARNSKHPKAFAITAKLPYWANKNIPHLIELAPSRKLLEEYKNGTISQSQYTKRYLRELDSREINAQELVDRLPEGAVLLCYENPNSFCHRHLAARWLMDRAKVKVKELS